MNHKPMFAVFVGSLIAMSAIAQEAPSGGQGQEGRMRREPPPQAYEACKGKKEGDTVQFTTRRGKEIQATCVNSPNGLFARPPHPPREHEEGAAKPD